MTAETPISSFVYTGPESPYGNRFSRAAGIMFAESARGEAELRMASLIPRGAGIASFLACPDRLSVIACMRTLPSYSRG